MKKSNETILFADPARLVRSYLAIGFVLGSVSCATSAAPESPGTPQEGSRMRSVFGERCTQACQSRQRTRALSTTEVDAECLGTCVQEEALPLIRRVADLPPVGRPVRVLGTLLGLPSEDAQGSLKLDDGVLVHIGEGPGFDEEARGYLGRRVEIAATVSDKQGLSVKLSQPTTIAPETVVPPLAGAAEAP